MDQALVEIIDQLRSDADNLRQAEHMDKGSLRAVATRIDIAVQLLRSL